MVSNNKHQLDQNTSSIFIFFQYFIKYANYYSYYSIFSLPLKIYYIKIYVKINCYNYL